MKLYRISQTENEDWDTYDSAVVCAPDEETARNISPSGCVMQDKDWRVSIYDQVWCSSPDKVTVEYLGEAADNIQQGVILASFNAG
jgi:hypothetical protein